MKGFLKKAKAEFEGILDNNTNQKPASNRPPDQPSHLPTHHQHCRGMEQDQASTIQEPTPLDIIRYRYHHGTNLGSIFVLEKWLHPSRFPEGATGTSELEAVKSWVDKIGIDATKQKFEEAWANAISDADIEWLLQEAKCESRYCHSFILDAS